MAVAASRRVFVPPASSVIDMPIRTGIRRIREHGFIDNLVEDQIEQCVQSLDALLGNELLGVYLYGSAMVGGLQRYSDIDVFAVSGRRLTLDEKAILEGRLLGISGLYRSTERRPIELTIVVKSAVNPWRYPPSFDFQYGEWLRKEFETGNVEPWPTRVKPDLALVITQILLASRTLHGAQLDQLLPSVPYKDFMIAIAEELDGLRTELSLDTRNVLLTLARVWRTVETDSIGSKQRAAEWAIQRLPKNYKPIVRRAAKIASGELEELWGDMSDIIAASADFMVDRIRSRLKSILVSNNAFKEISLVR